VGGDSEKLITLADAARRLDLTPDDVEAMIQNGQLEAFRIGGSLLRVRFGDIEAIRAERVGEPILTDPSASTVSTESAAGSAAASGGSRSKLRLSRGSRNQLRWSGFSDFLYFNDFYLVAFLIILTLLAIIYAL